jgi:hypothetical protein
MRRRKGLSSIYGFIMIFLLSMASLQTWSSAVSSMASIESASDQGNQLQQMQSIEHLVLTESGPNLTIANNGEIPSTAEFLRFGGPNDSRTIALDAEIAVGSSLTVHIPSGDAVEIVTALGNVFTVWPPSDPPGSVWSGDILRGGLDNAQLFQSPYYNSSFFLAEGPSVYAFSSSGSPQWSFDAGSGFITDVLPLSNGDVYVSAGYGSTSNSAELFELGPAGTLIQTYSGRLLQTVSGVSDDPTVPVTKGADSSYALYDGWFYSESGPFAGLVSDSFPLVGSDASDFYFYTISTVRDYNGVCDLSGNEFIVYSYTPNPIYGSVKLNWADYTRLTACSPYPQQLVGSAMGGGAIAVLLASPAYSVSTMEGYPGQNPFLTVVSDSGLTIYQGQAPENGYSAVATNGTDVYLALPQLSEVQVYSILKDNYTTYDIGIQASQLLFQDGDLFAISSDAVKVFGPSMNLEKTIELAPLSLASSSDSFVQEPALQAPSFLVLNATSYAALLINATGFTSLVLGRYS